MSAKRAFETKDIVYPEMYHWKGRFLQFRKGTRLAKAASQDRLKLNSLCYFDEGTHKNVRELEKTSIPLMGTHSPEQIVQVLNETLHLIHKNRKAQWTKNLV